MWPHTDESSISILFPELLLLTPSHLDRWHRATTMDKDRQGETHAVT